MIDPFIIPIIPPDLVQAIKIWLYFFSSVLVDSDWFLHLREHSDSVVECLTRDRGVAGSSLTGITVEQDTFIFA